MRVAGSNRYRPVLAAYAMRSLRFAYRRLLDRIVVAGDGELAVTVLTPAEHLLRLVRRDVTNGCRVVPFIA